MKCPKCNYMSFDYNRVCPKCGNDNTEEQTRLNLSPNKPDPPFFLASLIEMAGSANLEIPTDGAHGSSAPPAEAMDTQDILMTLDDLQSDNAQPESREPLDSSTDEIVLDTDEIVLDTDDSKADTLEPFDPSEDELLFDLEPASGEEDIESISIDPLDKKGFSDFEVPDEKQVDVDTVALREETSDIIDDTNIIDDTDIFLADAPEIPKMPLEETGPDATNIPEETDSQELFLSLDDLPGAESEPDPSAEDRIEEDHITFDLEEGFHQEEPPAPKDTPDETESAHEETQSLFLEEPSDITDEANLFLEDEPAEPVPGLNENKSADTHNKADDSKADKSQELFLSLDDMPGAESEPDPSAVDRIEEDHITFDLEEGFHQEEALKSPDQKGFWDSDEIEHPIADLNLEGSATQTTDSNLFSDMDIEPLDLELSLDDMEKKS